MPRTLYDANNKPILSEMDKMLKANFSLLGSAQGKYFRDLFAKAAAMHPRTIYGPNGQALPRIASQHAKASAKAFRMPITYSKAETE